MVDIIIIAVLVLMAIVGYRRGFFRSLTGIMSIILSFTIAVCFFTQVADFLKTTSVYETIYQNIEKNIASSDKATEDEEYSGIPEKLFKGIEKRASEIRDGALISIAEKLADIAIKMLSIVILFVIARVVMWIIIAILGVVKKMPVLGWFDSILGAVIGFARGFLIMYIVLFVVATGTSFNPENIFAKKINQSEFAKVIYNNNLFFDFINKD